MATSRLTAFASTSVLIVASRATLSKFARSPSRLVTVLEAVQLAERDVPDYIEVDHNKMVATYARIPALSDVPYPVVMEPHLVVEFYSR